MNDTTEGLIQLLREKETIPESGIAYSEDTLLRYLDESMKAFIVPAIQSVMEDNFVITQQFAMPQQSSPQTTTIGGLTYPINVNNTITIPSTATGLRLRDVYVLDSGGGFFNLPRLTSTQAAASAFSNTGANLSMYGTQFVGGFFLQGNEVQIYPYGLASGKLVRITYQQTPGDLCLITDAGKVLSIGTNTVVIDKVLPNIVIGDKVAVVSQDAPYQYRTMAQNGTTAYGSPDFLNSVEVTNVAGNILTFAAGVTDNIVVGDWICPAYNSVYAQNIPREMYPALIQKAASMCIHAAGDQSGYQMAQQEYKQMMDNALTILTPRVIGKPIKMLSPNSAFKANKGTNLGRW